MRALFTFLVFTFYLTASAQSDNYQLLPDASGFDRNTYEALAETATTDLITFLEDSDDFNGTNYAENFGIYDYGYYLHNETQSEGLEKARLAALDQITDQYYLLFLKETTKDGLYSNLEAVLVLPDIPNTCYSQSDFLLYVENSSSLAYEGNPNTIGEFIVAGITELQAKLDKAINCCVPTGNRKSNSICTSNCKTITDLVIELEATGFTEVNQVPFTIELNDLQSDYPVEIEFPIIPDVQGREIRHRLLGSLFNLTDEYRSLESDLSGIYDVTFHVIQNEDDLCDLNPAFTEFVKRGNSVPLLEEVYVIFDPSIAKFRLFLEETPIENTPVNLTRLKGFWDNVAKRLFKSALKKLAVANPGTVVLGVGLDYGLASVMEYFFQQDDHQDYVDALIFIVRERGVLGLAVTIGQQYLDNIAAEFVFSFANYFITRPIDDWNGAAVKDAIIQASVQSIFGATLKITSRVGGNVLRKFVTDVGGNPIILIRSLGNRRLVKAWNKLIEIPNLRVSIKSLETVSKWIDDGIELTFEAIEGGAKIINKNGDEVGELVKIEGDDVLAISDDFFVASGIPESFGTITVNSNTGEVFLNPGYIVKADGTIGFIEDVSSYGTQLIRNTIKGRGGLRGTLTGITKSQDAHHIIPVQLLKENDVVQRAVEAGFDFNKASNGIAIQKFVKATGQGRHGPHPKYTNQIRQYLNDWASQNPGFTAQAAKEELTDVVASIRNTIITSSKKINDLPLGL